LTDSAEPVSEVRPSPAPRVRLQPHEIIAALYFIAGVIVLERLPVTYPRAAIFLAHSVPTLSIFALAAAMSFFRFRSRRERWRHELRDIARCCVSIALVFSVSFVVKSFIHLVNSRVWDRELFAVDRMLHFGHSPTIFLVTLLDDVWFLHFLDFYYSLFYAVMFLAVPALLLAFLGHRGRVRFTAALVLMWIAGNVLYLVLPSWGPAFSDTALVLQALQSMPRTVWVQTQLYGELSSLVHAPLAPRFAKFGSVAAFPSLHVAVVTLFALATRKLLPAGAALLLIAVVLMQVGSVVTGYHFMVDGYAGALLAVLGWVVAGMWTRTLAES